jgi:hypothetical protein
VSQVDPFNLSDAEFEAVMIEIDATIRARSDRMPGRELVGMAEFTKKFKITLSNTHPTTLRIIGWFERMYGDRIKVDWDFGRSVVLIHGEICKLRGIRSYGTRLVVCSPIGVGIKLQQPTEHGPILTVTNLLEGEIDGLTVGLAKTLSTDECAEILKVYRQMFLAFTRLEAALGAHRGGTDAPYVKEAMHDLLISADSLIGARPNYGQSKWESLQAVEKIVKSCITEKGGKPRFIHKLAELFAVAESAGVPKIEPALIEAVQCSADVRYQSTLVPKLEAVKAHHAALAICGDLACGIKKTTALSEVDQYEFPLRGISLPGLALHYSPPAPPFIV